MILHLSNALTKRLKCPVSFKGTPVIQANRLDAWSGHCFRMGKFEHVMMMNDASLYTIVMPARGLNSINAFLSGFLPRVASIWSANGGQFDPLNQEIIVLNRTNRSLIGSMNDAIHSAKAFYEFKIGEKFQRTLEYHLNNTPYKTLGFESPSRLLPKLLSDKNT
jgi:hypothetical protein